MNIVCDVMLNYSEENQFFDFYEWNKDDSFLIIQEIPIIKISEMQMIEIEKSIIQISSSFLNDIWQKSKSIDYQFFTGLLVMSNDKVIGLRFDRNGVLIGKSSLLLDEEMAVIDENQDLCVTDFSYTIVSSSIFSFLTRREKEIQNKLLKKVTSFYLRKEYDVINFLYQELFSDKKSSYEQYQLLLDHIKYHYSTQTEKLLDIICLI